MVDIVREIDAVEREVGGGRLDGAEAAGRPAPDGTRRRSTTSGTR